ncbi:MAG: hypothetical protein HRF47_09465 [Chloroflexota bacterium]|jgi:hypothetical protein
MRYQIPPDVLHYEVRLLFGLTAQDIMIAGVAVIFGIQRFGIVVGLTLGVLALLGLKRYERLGHRSLLMYAALYLWHRLRPSQALMPRVLPGGGVAQMTVHDWDGQEMYRVENGG